MWHTYVKSRPVVCDLPTRKVKDSSCISPEDCICLHLGFLAVCSYPGACVSPDTFPPSVGKEILSKWGLPFRGCPDPCVGFLSCTGVMIPCHCELLSAFPGSWCLYPCFLPTSPQPRVYFQNFLTFSAFLLWFRLFFLSHSLKEVI